jgi:hypothetical protein
MGNDTFSQVLTVMDQQNQLPDGSPHKEVLAKKKLKKQQEEQEPGGFLGEARKYVKRTQPTLLNNQLGVSDQNIRTTNILGV